jgi:hypothetical protein
MKLTVFLVTKGREKFLDQILNSFEKLFPLDVDFLILDAKKSYKFFKLDSIFFSNSE